MMSVNEAFAAGTIDRQPKVVLASNGKKFANMTLSVEVEGKSHNGNPAKYKSFVKVSTFSKAAVEEIEKLRAGDAAFARGRLQTRKYTDQNDGLEKEITSIYAYTVSQIEPDDPTFSQNLAQGPIGFNPA